MSDKISKFNYFYETLTSKTSKYKTFYETICKCNFVFALYKLKAEQLHYAVITKRKLAKFDKNMLYFIYNLGFILFIFFELCYKQSVYQAFN